MRKTRTNAQLLARSVRSVGKKIILLLNARQKQRLTRPVHVVSEQDSGTYQDIVTITEVNGDNETVNQVRKRATVKANNSLQE